MGVGLDLVSVDEVVESVARQGERFLERTFTPAELRECGGDPRRLAVRFAAKEAAMKALGIGDLRPPWTSIELRSGAGGAGRGDGGGETLELSGTAAELARRRGYARLEVSVSQGRRTAAAVVVSVSA